MAYIQRLIYARDLMKSKSDSQVSMLYVLSECGSVGCIVGWCTNDKEHFPEFMFSPYLGQFYRRDDGSYFGGVGDYAKVGAELFSIPLSDARDLFCDVGGDNWLDYFLFGEEAFTDDGLHPLDRDVAIARLEYAIGRYSKGLPLSQEAVP